MATYKVLQDIEAEDKILGPLTLKQFIFAVITIVLCFLAFFIGKASWILALPWLLPIAFFGFMAAPIGKDQPNDVWLAARIRFLIKPRKRLWDQSGMQELVTITAPKKIETSRTDGLSQTEVKSRLSALSNMMDTRGWAIKNVDTNMGYDMHSNHSASSERLVTISSNLLANDLAVIHPSEDILDPLNNSTAQRIDSTIKQKQQEKISLLKNSVLHGSTSSDTTINKPQIPKVNYDFIVDETPHIDPGYAMFGSKVITPSGDKSTSLSNPEKPSAEEELILNKIHQNQEIIKNINSSSHEHRLDPINSSDKNKAQTLNKETAPNVILKELGQANDISVASIANLAKHAEQETALSNDDVISLH